MGRSIRTCCLVAFLIPFASHAQCPPGELEVTIQVGTDDYGYEIYWELLPNGAACGEGTIFSGGNPAVGCDGAGEQNQVLGGYGNNANVSEGPFCLEEGVSYDIFWADDWGDGGATFTVFIDGLFAALFEGSGEGNTFTFTVVAPAQVDMAITELRVPHYTVPGRAAVVTGDIITLGSDPVTSFDLNYSVNGGDPITTTISGLSLDPGDSYEFFHTVPWIPGAPASVLVTAWASNINGMEDQVPDNDAMAQQVLINPPTPDIINSYFWNTPVVEVLATSNQDILVPRDLDFHPDPERNELWVINKDVANTGGSTVRFFGPGEDDMTWLWQRDPNAWHFMNQPTGIAFGDNGNFATSPGIFDANQSGGSPFTGPTLWSGDPDIYAQPLFGPLGSHLDMLHVNPRCQGIAHDFWNRYWVVDGHVGDITMNDFRKDHGPGNSWHGDAIIRRYGEFTITRDPGDHIVSHTVLDKETGWLYVVDHGGQRVLRLDINSGQVSGPATFGPWETYVEYTQVTGYDWEVIINEGLVEPAGIDIVGTKLLVSDHATGEVIAYDLAAEGIPEMGRLATGEPGIMGIKVGPDGHIWYVNATLHQMGRILPGGTVGVEEANATPALLLHPNPTQDRLFIAGAQTMDTNMPVRLFDAVGRQVALFSLGELQRGMDISQLGAGHYRAIVGADGRVAPLAFIVQR